MWLSRRLQIPIPDDAEPDMVAVSAIPRIGFSWKSSWQEQEGDLLDEQG
jgi:hypothetical protein